MTKKYADFNRNILLYFFQLFDDHYHLHHSEIRKRSIEPSHHHQMRLNNDDRVRWSQQQHIKSRKKRDFLTFHDPKPYPMLMGKNRVMTTDPKWPAMWYLVSSNSFYFYVYHHVLHYLCIKSILVRCFGLNVL